METTYGYITGILSTAYFIAIMTCRGRCELALLHDNITFECNLNQHLHTLIWKHDNNKIYHQTYSDGASLKRKWQISNVSFQDAGNYTCWQFLTQGAMKKSHFRLQVQGYPRLSILQNLTVEGENITATCCVETTLQEHGISFKWYIAESPILFHHEEKLTEVTSTNFRNDCSDILFTISRVFDSQRLRCVIQNTLHASDSKQLQVLWLPRMLRIHVNNVWANHSTDLVAGKAYNITCFAIESNPTVQLNMSINNNLKETKMVAIKDNTSEVNIQDVVVTSGQNITVQCVATADFTRNKRKETLELYPFVLPVVKQISINGHPVNKETDVTLGKLYLLICESESSQSNTYLLWTINGNHVEGNVHHFENVSNGVIYSKVNITFAFERHRSIVECATNDSRSEFRVTESITVFAYGAPDLDILESNKSQSGTMVVYHNRRLNFTCLALNKNKLLKLQWTRNGKHLTNGGVENVTENVTVIFKSIVLNNDTTNLCCTISSDSQLQQEQKCLKIEVFESPDLEIYYDGMNSSQRFIAYAHESVSLTCECDRSRSVVRLEWQIPSLTTSEKQIYLHTTNASNNETLTTSLRMTMPSSTLLNVSCLAIGRRNKEWRKSAFIEFYYFPEIGMVLDGVVSTGKIVFTPLGANHTVTCNVKGFTISPCRVHLSVNGTDSSWVTNITESIKLNTSNSHLLKFQALSREYHSECNLKCPTISENISSSLILKTFVPPVINIFFMGKRVATNSHITLRDAVNIFTCNASGGGPHVSLDWLYDSDEITKIYITTQPETFGSSIGDPVVSDFHFRVDVTEFTQITCTSTGELEGQKRNVTISLSRRHVQVTREQDSKETGLYALSAIPVVVLAFVLGLLLHKNFNRIQSFTFLASRSELINRENPETRCGSLDDTVGQEQIPGASCSHYRDPATMRRKQSVALPKIPKENRRSMKDYASLRIKSLHSKIYNRRDMCFVLQLKKGALIDRWMATVMDERGKKKCLFVSSLKEDKHVKKRYHWDLYVQKVMELPYQQALVKYEGICIDRANILLLQKYQVVRSFEEFLKGRQSDQGAITMRDVLGYAAQIVAGMEMIVTYGFLHPGLSIKKILITEKHCCKLYDFCLQEDAVMKLISIKEKDGRQKLPPETEERNEYTWASDSWSVSTSICEAISYVHESNLENTYQSQDGEADIPDYIHNKLQECCVKDPIHRPPIRELKEAFSQWLTDPDLSVVPKIQEETSSESSSSEIDEEDGYMAMAGNADIQTPDASATSNL